MKFLIRHVVPLLVLCQIGLPIQADELVLAGDSQVSHVPLPTGSDAPQLLPYPMAAGELAYLPDGRLLAIRDIESVAGTLLGLMLIQVHADGTATDLGEIKAADVGFGWEEALDLVVDAKGRLFLLASVFHSNPPTVDRQLVELDPDDATTLSMRGLDRVVRWLARGPSGLWASTENGLELLDPDSGHFTFVQEQGVGGADGETDSTGAIWMFGGGGTCSPPCFTYTRLDPATGAITDYRALYPEFLVVRDLTVRRICQSSATTLCLQGGRFQAEARWRDFSDRSGDGIVAAARSAESGLLWFFDAANWELTVKVLDGCGANGHFWVFASGSTNVEYTLKVTDLETGEERIYENPLGRTAVTVTDTSAFACG